MKASGNVPNANWNRDNLQANLNRNDADNRDDNIGGRSAVNVYDEVELNERSHPPSILPISASKLWLWKIFVSLPRWSSSIKRNFKIAISWWLLALMRCEAFKGLGAFLAMINSDRQSKILISKLWPRAYRHFFSKRTFISATNL